jgi:hypothetical protein
MFAALYAQHRLGHRHLAGDLPADARNTQIVHADLAGHVTPFNDALSALAPSHLWNMAPTLGRAALNAEVTKQASAVAYANDFKLMMVVALVALPLIFLLKRANAARRGGDSGVTVVLSEAKDIIAACRRHEILRYAQDDRPSVHST